MRNLCVVHPNFEISLKKFSSEGPLGCNTGTSALPDMYARARGCCALAYISGKSRVPVLQLICYTSGEAALFIS